MTEPKSDSTGYLPLSKKQKIGVAVLVCILGVVVGGQYMLNTPYSMSNVDKYAEDTIYTMDGEPVEKVGYSERRGISGYRAGNVCSIEYQARHTNGGTDPITLMVNGEQVFHSEPSQGIDGVIDRLTGHSFAEEKTIPVQDGDTLTIVKGDEEWTYEVHHNGYSVVGEDCGDYDSIQTAIDNAEDGENIYVTSGHYEESLNLSGKNVAIKSINPDQRFHNSNVAVGNGDVTIAPPADSPTRMIDGQERIVGIYTSEMGAGQGAVVSGITVDASNVEVGIFAENITYTERSQVSIAPVMITDGNVTGASVENIVERNPKGDVSTSGEDASAHVWEADWKGSLFLNLRNVLYLPAENVEYRVNGEVVTPATDSFHGRGNIVLSESGLSDGDVIHLIWTPTDTVLVEHVYGK